MLQHPDISEGQHSQAWAGTVPETVLAVQLPGCVLDIVKCASVDRLLTAENRWEEIRTSCD